MTKVAIVYSSGNGHTQKIAEHIAQGASQVQETDVHLINVTDMTDDHWQTLHTSDGIIFGSPTYLGSISSDFKKFMETTGRFWLDQKWANKMAGGFTVSSQHSGDKLNTLTSLALFAAQHGMIWAGLNHVGSMHTGDGKNTNECGAWLGLMALASRDKNEKIRASDLGTATLFGERLAKATQRWAKGA